MNDERYVLWLTRIHGIGLKKQQMLIKYFGSAYGVFTASEALLKSLSILNQENTNQILKSQRESLVEKFERELSEKQICFVSRYHKRYPTLLREIHMPPTGIYVAGTLPDEQLALVSIIGSRRCSEYGLSVAHQLSKELAEYGVGVVSGMARGVDSMAHRGAMDGQGITVAVLGSGLDVCYPAENKSLYKKIIQNGCVISEYPPGTGPLPRHFPARNRIISGLSWAVVVVEAAERSGTLITVDEALAQGREVLTVPGNITSKLSKGANRLIQQGSTPVTSGNDILFALGLERLETDRKPEQVLLEDALTQEERRIYQHIGTEPVSVDWIIREVHDQAQMVQCSLTTLEIKGFVQRLPGQRYQRK